MGVNNMLKKCCPCASWLRDDTIPPRQPDAEQAEGLLDHEKYEWPAAEILSDLCEELADLVRTCL